MGGQQAVTSSTSAAQVIWVLVHQLGLVRVKGSTGPALIHRAGTGTRILRRDWLDKPWLGVFDDVWCYSLFFTFVKYLKGAGGDGEATAC